MRRKGADFSGKISCYSWGVSQGQYKEYSFVKRRQAGQHSSEGGQGTGQRTCCVRWGLEKAVLICRGLCFFTSLLSYRQFLRLDVLKQRCVPMNSLTKIILASAGHGGKGWVRERKDDEVGTWKT